MMNRVLSATLGVLLRCATRALAQQGTTEVRGAVKTRKQASAVPGVAITIRNRDTGMVRETVTGADGT